MNERSDAQRKQSRKWHATRAIEEALHSPDVERAADWLMRHPPGARLPDELEPGHEAGPDEPEDDEPRYDPEDEDEPGYYGEGELADYDPRTGRSGQDDWK